MIFTIYWVNYLLLYKWKYQFAFKLGPDEEYLRQAKEKFEERWRHPPSQVNKNRIFELMFEFACYNINFFFQGRNKFGWFLSNSDVSLW